MKLNGRVKHLEAKLTATADPVWVRFGQALREFGRDWRPPKGAAEDASLESDWERLLHEHPELGE